MAGKAIFMAGKIDKETGAIRDVAMQRTDDMDNTVGGGVDRGSNWQVGDLFDTDTRPMVAGARSGERDPNLDKSKVKGIAKKIRYGARGWAVKGRQQLAKKITDVLKSFKAAKTAGDIHKGTNELGKQNPKQQLF